MSLLLREFSDVDEVLKDDVYGFKVITVDKDCPASQCGLVPFFDFIIYAASERLLSKEIQFGDKPRLQQIVEMHENKPLKFTVLNVKNWTLRDLNFVPAKQSFKMGLSGIKVRQSAFRHTLDKVGHVMGVQQGSPAEDSGLEIFTDYILGTGQGDIFTTLDSVTKTLSEYEDNPLILMVYSNVADTVRMVKIIPSKRWHNCRGMIGCDIGMGSSAHSIARDTSTATFRFISPDIIKRSSVVYPPQKPHKTKLKHDIVCQLGYGEILAIGTNEKVVVELNWKLANGAHAIAMLNPRNYTRLPELG